MIITCLFMQDIVADNYDEAITALSGAVRRAATNEQEQTPSNLATVTVVFERSTTLITTNMSIVVRDAVSLLLFCLHI